MYDYHTTRVQKLSGGDQGSVGREESQWDGPRLSSLSGRNEIKFKLLGRGTSSSQMEIDWDDLAQKVLLLKTRIQGEKMSGPRKFWDQSRARTSYLSSSDGALVTIPDFKIGSINVYSLFITVWMWQCLLKKFHIPASISSFHLLHARPGQSGSIWWTIMVHRYVGRENRGVIFRDVGFEVI